MTPPCGCAPKQKFTLSRSSSGEPFGEVAGHSDTRLPRLGRHVHRGDHARAEVRDKDSATE